MQSYPIRVSQVNTRKTVLCITTVLHVTTVTTNNHIDKDRLLGDIKGIKTSTDRQLNIRHLKHILISIQ